MTFNAHRIHYDEKYAREIEGYPGIVIHGPLIATRLCHFVTDKIGNPPSEFSFRAEAPAFAGSPLRLSTAKDGQLQSVTAVRTDGIVAMSAKAIA
jgi:3-methylfumaryl-CoA hydratase